MKYFYFLIALVSTQAFAIKPCDELKSEIAANIEKKGVVQYTLDIIPSGDVGDQMKVGSCEGGTKSIVYINKQKRLSEQTAQCYWMENRTGKFTWVKASSVYRSAITKKQCFGLDSCDGGEGRSGGGCYKWADSADAPRQSW
ncbi:hypothetical protein CSQ89_14130 [Chitinimonas sp. BJB300]|nr:hypothetical protein CSQ89_14130 [Chitinimonas sp. BJB300]TSJ87086.1 DUF1161 domain-containing protein [Chitinimonas sp. BJB300]